MIKNHLIKKNIFVTPSDWLISFTKSQDCLELKFESIDPKNYSEYQDLHSLILKAIADRVYENKLNNDQAWLIYEDVIKDFNKAKDKNQYLITVLDKYS